MDLSIIIPTFNESRNVGIITERIREALKPGKYNYEIWFIDDSRDETPQILEQLSRKYPQVHYVHRENGRGLGTAVVEGFQQSSGKYMVVMDADLQHPPELLPVIAQRLREGIEVVIPSRFVPGGSDGGLNPFRKLVSWTARVIGQVFIKRLRHISDCTGGYFGLRRSVIEGADLDPIGWKILMEVLVKGKYKTVHEVPYAFTERNAGESKMSTHEQWNYIRHIGKLIVSSPEDRRFYLFCFVGLLGVFVNLIVLEILLHMLHLQPVTASVIASFIAMVNNYVWNDRLTWKDHAHSSPGRKLLQFVQFALISSVGIGITALFVKLFVWRHWTAVFGQLTGIIIATGWGYIANNYWTWSKNDSEPGGSKIRVTHEPPEQMGTPNNTVAQSI